VGTGSPEKEDGSYFVTGDTFKNHRMKEGGCQKSKENTLKKKSTK
jgi:hypothetical protein